MAWKRGKNGRWQKPDDSPELLPALPIAEEPPEPADDDPDKPGARLKPENRWNRDKANVIQSCVAFGITHRQIAIYVGMRQASMERVYRREIALGSVAANYLVARQLYTLATKGTGREKVAACIFWCKTRMGWRETVHVENTGEIEHRVVKTKRDDTIFDKMSSNELDDYINDNLRAA